MNKRGRPKLDSSGKSIRRTFRFSPKFSYLIDECAKYENMSTSAWIRKILEKHIPVFTPFITLQTIKGPSIKEWEKRGFKFKRQKLLEKNNIPYELIEEKRKNENIR